MIGLAGTLTFHLVVTRAIKGVFPGERVTPEQEENSLRALK